MRILLLLILFCSNAATSQTGNSILSKLDALAKSPVLSNGVVAFHAEFCDSNHIVCTSNSNLSLPSASTMKVITTAASLDVLGGSHTFETRVWIGGVDSVGVVEDAIVVEGGGDPTILSKYYPNQKNIFSRICDALIERGVGEIKGDIVVDASCFGSEYIPAGWVWGDIGNYYGAGASGMSVYDNMLKLHFKSGSKFGSPTTVWKYEPKTEGLTFDNQVISAPIKRDEAYVYGAPYSQFRTLRGKIPSNRIDFVVKASLHDPADVFAEILRDSILGRGIKVLGGSTTVRKLRVSGQSIPQKGKILYKQQSPELRSIVHWTNQKSNNMYAEHLLRHVGMKKLGKGEIGASTDAVKNHFAAQGVNVTGLYMNDGSGLSRSNSLNAINLVSVLRYMSEVSESSKDFINSLPVAGRTGTLASLGKGTVIDGRIQAKSGTMARIKSYAGYVPCKSGRRIAFCIILNNYSCSSYLIKKKIEPVLIELQNYALKH